MKESQLLPRANFPVYGLQPADALQGSVLLLPCRQAGCRPEGKIIIGCSPKKARLYSPPLSARTQAKLPVNQAKTTCAQLALCQQALPVGGRILQIDGSPHRTASP